ncbi:MAG: hypothetical protein WDZ35_04895 [Crocinitomicaceae bacterium]
MLVNLYRDKTPIAIFSLPLLIGLLALPIFFFPADQSYYFLKWQSDMEAQVIATPGLNYLFTVLLVSLNAHQLNNVYNRHTFYSKSSFLPGFIYVLLLFSFNELRFSPNLIAHLFLIFTLGQLLKLRRQEDAKAIIFWAAFFIGMAIAFSSFQTITLLLPWLALTVFKPFVWREWFMVLLGGAIPLAYYLSVLFMVKNGIDFKMAEVVPRPKITLDLFKLSSYALTILIITGSLLKYIMILRTEVIRFKKQSFVLLHFCWLSVVIWGIGYFIFEQIYLSFTLPFAFFIATALLHSGKKYTVNLIVIIWLIISVANVLL